MIESAILGSSAILFAKALDHVLTARMSFFDTTPLGRILSIFTSDLNAVDVDFPIAFSHMLFYSNIVVAYACLTVAIVPLVASIFVPWILLAIWAVNIYKWAPLQIKRLDRTYASFHVSKLSEGIVGRSSIRSCSREGDFITSLHGAIDNLNGIHFSSYACQSWVSTAQALISIILYLFTGFMVLIKRHSLHPSLAFVVLLAAEDLTWYIQVVLLLMTGVQRSTASVGRVGFYCTSLSQEPPKHVYASTIPQGWPSKAHIQFTNVAMRYRPNLPLVLKGLTLEIKSGERVGIVGRAGAGKSSILATLTRAVELAEGCITIDGVDISKIGLHDLRQQIAVIPQDPTLFKGTIRSTLIAELPDEEDRRLKADDSSSQTNDMDSTLLDALAKSFLIPKSTHPHQANEKDLQLLHSPRPHLLNLNSPVSSGGSNLSHGERQLLMIARAIVRDRSIVLCDEATSAIDPETDAKVQESMWVGFAGKTFISIAHQISTIVGFDNIVVLDSGRLVECGTPGKLYEWEDGLFRGLCERSRVVVGG